MRDKLFLLLACLLAAALPNARGRLLKDSSSRTSLSSSALPGAAAGPSPLLNAPPTGGWRPVPGARPVPPGGQQGSPEMQPRIIDGDADAELALFPYAAFVQFQVNETTAFRCSGSLIGPSHVLTAAHCQTHEGHKAEPSQLRVWIRGEWFAAAAAYPHEGYTEADSERPPSQPSNDIGIIALASPCAVAPVRLPGGAAADDALGTRQLAQPVPTAGTRVFAAGFGITEDGDTSDVLRYTDLTVFADSECPPAYADTFCGGGVSGFTCQGDSGGPIVLPSLSGDSVVGVTSFGPSDCRMPYSYYTRVEDHLPWVKEKLALPIPEASSSSGGSKVSSGSAAASSPAIASNVEDWLISLPSSR